MQTKDFNDFGSFDFMKAAPLMGGISLVMLFLAVALIVTKGFKFGIDFAGGTEMQVKFAETPDVTKIRKALEEAGVGGAMVQSFGTDNEVIIRMQQADGATASETNKKNQEEIGKVTTALKKDLNLTDDGIRRIDSVGPQVGSELKTQAMLSVFYSLLAILIYIGLRFDFRFAPGAVLCLFHDTIVVLGVLALFGREINLPVLAGILTLIGYSLNDTIIVFDNIRANEPVYKQKGLGFVINRSTNEMMVRTILTSGTTLISALFLYIMGSGVIQDIAFVMLLGVILGTYSSIYVASPLIPITEKIMAKFA